MARRIIFIALALAGAAAIIAGIRIGDPETIYRFASQI